MTCPKCHSDDWKLASLVHHEGLTNVSTATKATGVGIGGGGISVGVGGAKTNGTHQTELSRLAGPPGGVTVSTFLILGSVVFFILGFFNFLWFILMTFCVIGVFAVWPSEQKAFAAAYEKWRRTKICQRCGTFYEWLKPEDETLKPEDESAKVEPTQNAKLSNPESSYNANTQVTVTTCPKCRYMNDGTPQECGRCSTKIET